jgi:hypothetical protein
MPNSAPQRCLALASKDSNTGASSPDELEMTCKTSEVAVCCSRASFSSRVRAATCSWSSVVDTPAIGALCALGLATRCPFTGCPLSPRRCMSLPYGGFTTMLNTTQFSTFPPRQDVRFGSEADICGAKTNVRFGPIADIRRLRLIQDRSAHNEVVCDPILIRERAMNALGVRRPTAA